MLALKNTFNVTEDDIMNLNENSDEWIELKHHYERIVIKY
jgi:hypothetical protein